MADFPREIGTEGFPDEFIEEAIGKGANAGKQETFGSFNWGGSFVWDFGWAVSSPQQSCLECGQ